ncbi:MAG: hypothetical protein GY749_33945 [Desulfobacteraceae bacterium]|nr:hypothetical protein [Desulfobacteraceae bacterium]
MIYTIIVSVIIIVIGLIIIPPFVVIPVIARFKIRMPRDPGLLVMDPKYFPKYVSEYLSHIRSLLKNEGFEMALDAIQPEQEPDMTTSYFRLFVNKAKQDTAVAIISLGNSKEGEKRVTNAFTEISTEFSPDKKITTNNIVTPPVFRDVPENPIFRFPGEQNLGVLYKTHQKIVSEAGENGKRFLPPRGGELKYLRDTLVNSLDMQIKTGYLYSDEAGGVYRPTWKGAFLMMWKSAFGTIKMIRLRRKRPS